MSDLPPFRKLELQQLAEAVSSDYAVNGVLNPELVAKEQGITFSYGHYKNAFDGLLQHRFGKFHIFLNKDRTPDAQHPRMRYTFSHELGHYFIDEHRNALRSGKVSSHPSFNSMMPKNIAEKEADFFASCLLLPSAKFKSFCFRKPLTAKLLEDIAGHFKVSVSAAIFRYVELSMFPMMIIMSKDGNIEWKMHTSGFKYRFIPDKGKPVPPLTAAGEFYLKGRKYQTEEIVFADDWFSDLNRIKEEQFYEKCYYLSGNKVMSVIWKKEK